VFIKELPGLDSPFVLAPLAGITNSSFRLLCREMGAGLSYTEMISSKGIKYENKKTGELLALRPEEGPVGIQLFGSDPSDFVSAAEMLKPRGFKLVDINMGCPVPKVVKNGEGSALLRKPDLAWTIVKALVKGTGLPITVKMRIGFENDYKERGFDPAEFAAVLEDAGASAITVHGRTREQFYSGKADRAEIRRIKSAVRIPVIANGDVFTAEDGMRMMDETGCEMVMVARGAMGNPWIFRELNAAYKGQPIPDRPDIEEIIAVVERHIELDRALKGEHGTVIEMRKHVSWYTKGIPGAARLRTRINTAGTVEELTATIEALRDYV